jgi:hypothetical protein
VSGLPEFKRVPRHRVMPFVTGVFSRPGTSGSQLAQLVEFEDGHFRAIFHAAYFDLGEGQEPTSSQWSSLKKRLKRHGKAVFVAKQVGRNRCPSGAPSKDPRCYYIDFGFFLYD